MPPYKRLVDWARTALTLAITAALVGLSPGPAAYQALAAENDSAPVAPEPVRLQLPDVNSPAAGLQTPQAPTTIPGMDASGAMPQAAPASGEASVSQAAAVAPAASPAASASPAALPSGAVASAGASVATPGAGPETPVVSPEAVTEGLKAPDQAAAGLPQAGREASASRLPAASRAAGAESRVGAASQASDAQLRENGSELFDQSAAHAAMAEPAVLPSGSSSRSAALSKGASRGVGEKVVRAAGFVGAPVATTHVMLSAAHGGWTGALSSLGALGNLVGNGLAFYFPIPQVYKTFKEGNAKGTPLASALLMVGASLALGLVNATVAQKAFWGIQNLFGALSMVSVFPAGWWLARRGGKGLSHGWALAATVATSVTVLGLSAGLYFAAAPLLPGIVAAALPATLGATTTWMGMIMAAVAAPVVATVMRRALKAYNDPLMGPPTLKRTVAFSALAIAVAYVLAQAAFFGPAALATLVFPLTMSKVTLFVQIATGVMFLGMFKPDIQAIFNGKPPHGFTPAFSMTFFLSSMGMLLWTLNAALTSAPADRTKWMVYTLVNAVYAVTSLAAYRGAKRAAKEPPAPPTPPAPGADETPSASAEAPAAAAAPPQAERIEPALNIPETPAAEEPVAPAVTAASGQAAAPAEAAARPAAPAPRALKKADWAVMGLLAAAGVAAAAFLAPTFGGIALGLSVGFSAAQAYRQLRVSPNGVGVKDVAATLALAGLGAAAGYWIRPTFFAAAIGLSTGLALFQGYWKGREARLARGLMPETRRVEPTIDLPEAAQPTEQAASQVAQPEPAPRAVSETASEGSADSEAAFVPAAVPAAAPEGAAPAPLKATASWKSLPESARAMETAKLAEAARAAGVRARRIAKDARLVSAAINLDDGRARWIFTYESASRRQEISIYSKGSAARALPKGPKRATLRLNRIAAAAALQDAYSQLKRAKPGFKPARVELVARGDAADYVFTDAKGRSSEIAPAAAQTSGAKAPRSVAGLPADALAATDESLLAAKAAAQRRARAGAPDAQLVGVAINLDSPSSRWIFEFRSKAKGQRIRVYSKSVTVSRWPGNAPGPVLWDSRLAAVSGVEAAYAALKQQKHWFKPVRVELRPTWNSAPEWVFLDKIGRKQRVSSAPATPVAPTAAPDDSQSKPAPGQVEPAPSAPASPQESAQPPPAPPSDRAPPGDAAQKQAENGPHIHEDFFGFRRVDGLKPDPSLGLLPVSADSARIIDQISRQFSVPREKVIALGAAVNIPKDAPAHEWYGVYRRLQRLNADQFKRFDSQKYHGWSSFRHLTNIRYAAGWKGDLQRAAEVHKHFLGFFVRFPYHLFDSFVFGYFRQNISFEFFHSTENFLDMAKAGNAEKWLEVALREQASKGSGPFGAWLASPMGRALDRYLVSPLLSPLLTFLKRRIVMAVFSAVAMGVLGAFAPGIAVMALPLTAIPLLGPVLVGLAHGLPVAVGQIPFLGSFLAPVVGAATMALLKDLVVGPLLNTAILSTFMTLGPSLRQHHMLMQDADPRRRIGMGEAVLGAMASGKFWRDFAAQNARSFLGLVTVGAEIQGILTYASGVDAAVNPAYHGVTGHEFHLFHAIGSAVESPKGQSVIPFGGAITWGNALLYKAQTALGFNISDFVMHSLNGHLLHSSAAGIVQASSHRLELQAAAAKGDKAAQAELARENAPYQFDKDLWKRSPAEIAARLKEIMASAGNLPKEIQAVKEHQVWLQKQIAQADQQMDQLKAQRNPLTPDELARYKALLEKLKQQQAQSYSQSKLAEAHDIKNPKADDDARLKELKSLRDQYDKVLAAQSSQQSPGMTDDMAVRQAMLKALSEHLTAVADNKSEALHTGAVGVSQAEVDKLRKMVGEIDDLRAEARTEMATRDATQKLLDVSNKARNEALNERRNGKAELAFHQTMSKLATVMDMALALNEINAAETAVNNMLNLVQQNVTQAQNALNQNQQNLANANQNNQNIQTWTQQNQQTVNSDQSTQSELTTDQGLASQAVNAFQSYQSDAQTYINMVNAQDKGQSPTAVAEYQRRLALLPQVQQWRTTGNPNDPSAFSLSEFQSMLTEINGYITQAQNGLQQIPTVPLQFAGVLIVAIPGPAVNISNPTKAQMLQVLSQRATYWQGQLSTYQNDLNQINAMLNPSNTATTTDEFGNVTPQSLPVWLAQETQSQAQMQAQVQQFAATIDAAAAQINAYSGASLPPLSGMSLTQLQNTVLNYGNQLQALKLPPAPANNTAAQTAADQAAFAELQIADYLPRLAHDVIIWSQDSATITAINSAMATTLPQAQKGLQGVVTMVNNILADDQADVNYVNNGGDAQALINRKTNLLQNEILPPLQAAQSLVQNYLIPYQQQSIAQADPKTGQLQELFNDQLTLMNTTQNLYNNQVPWSIATWGGSSSDPAGSHADIAAFRTTLQNALNGTPSQEGVLQYQTEVQNRANPNYTGTEVLYGETQPYSLPRKITQYGAEMTQRASQINTIDPQINQILSQITTMVAADPDLKGKNYNLQNLLLPTGIGTDAGSVAKVNALVNNGTFQALSTALQQVAADAQAAGGGNTGVTINAGVGSGSVPVGTQPSPTVSQDTQIALLALEAAKRLVFTSAQQPGPTGNLDPSCAAFAIARYLYSNSVVQGAQSALETEIPPAQKFLGDAVTALNAAIADTNQSDAYVNSGGTSETAAQVYARQIATFTNLNSFLTEGVTFMGLKLGWDNSSFSTINQVGTYYNSLTQVYQGGITADQNELTALQKISTALQGEMTTLQADKAEVTSWLSQLDNPEDSALRQVNQSIDTIQDQTRKVLEANVQWHDLTDQVGRSQTILKADLVQMDQKQQALMQELQSLNLTDMAGALPPDLVQKIKELRLNQGMWAIDPGDKGQAEALVVKKSQYAAFIDSVLGMFQGQDPNQDLSSIRTDLLNNPKDLASIIPNASVIDFSDNADGFYLVYQSQFAVPDGLTTSSWVTLGNVAKVWGNNISVTGYQFASPPESAAADGASNAPYGDKGIEVQVESLQGKNWVNYLTVDLHRFGLDIPANDTLGAEANVMRLMVFDDYALLAMDGKLYVGLAGFGDMAADQPANNPYYYGGNLRTEVKLTPVMSLTAEQQELIANDPRQFLETVNLDFTGYNNQLDQNFIISAQGDNKYYSRTQIGPSFNLARLIADAQGKTDPGDAFTLTLFGANTSGTDDTTEKSVGATIVKGFTLKDDNGKPWLAINNSLTGEMGTAYNDATDKLSVSLPNQGIVISGQGEMLGDGSAYYAQIQKKMNEHSSIALGYGAPAVGENNQLSLTMNSGFTLGELWGAVVGNAGSDLKGGDELKQFNTDMDAFFKNEGKSSQSVQELQRVFEQDVARKLITQDMGQLSRDIGDLRKAGALLDNTRVQSMVGFVSNGVGNDTADLAVGGGMVVGTETTMTLNKTQKALIDAKAQNLYLDGLQLQQNFVETTKQWQQDVTELAQAQWDLKLAQFMAQNSPDPAIRQEGQLQVAQATDRLHQALLKYNILTGRDPTAPMPFANLNASDLQALISSVRQDVSTPDSMSRLLHSLDAEQLQKVLGKNPTNILDWVPFIDQFTAGIGVQLQDVMANQAFTVGASIRLPFYDPTSKAADKSYRFESQASIEEMEQAYSQQRLDAALEAQRAQAARQSADTVRPEVTAAADALGQAIREYRNGLIPAETLRQAFDSWHWYMTTTLDADSQATLESAWSRTDQSLEHAQLFPEGGTIKLDSLDDALALAVQRSHGLHEVAQREQAAAAMTQANDHRIQKFWIDLHMGVDLTATGVGFLPSLGPTGFPITPIPGFQFKPEELRELQVKEGQAQTDYYRILQAKIQSDLALQLYQGVAQYHASVQALSLYNDSILPDLQAKVDAARAAGGEAAVSAQKNLDDAKLMRDQAAQAQRQAQATINFLLDRSADAPLDIDLSSDQALASLKGVMTQLRPVDAQQAILQTRVDAAQAYEQIVDKGLQVDQLATEPVSLAVRSLGRLIKALGDDDAGDPDKVAAARVRTLTEQRALDSYGGQVQTEVGKELAALSLAKDQLARLQSRTDAQSQADIDALKERIDGLKASLMALGIDPDKAPSAQAGAQPVPQSFTELTQRLADSERAMTGREPDAPITVPDADVQEHQADSYLRYYYAKQTLGHDPIDKSYLEGWIEVRLKSQDTPPEVLLALAKLQQEKADRLWRTDQEGAASRADILSSQFETDVALLRWAQDQLANPGSPGAPSGVKLGEFTAGLRQKLLEESSEISAVLDLDQSVPPQARLDQLMALVPHDSRTAADLQQLGAGFIQQIRSQEETIINKTLFDGGLQLPTGNEDSLINQIKADTIAERMSYKGFTPVFAFGIFRGQSVSAGTLQAPDPREIEQGLSNILSDSLRKDLQATGQLQQLSLRMNSLMSKVEDGAHELQARAQLIQTCEREYKAELGLQQANPSDQNLAAVEAARSRLVDAWLGFSNQMVQTKGDFISLVTELQALDPSLIDKTAQAPSQAPLQAPDLTPQARDREGDLLDYWTDRMLDEGFGQAQDAYLQSLTAGLKPAQAATLGRAIHDLQASIDQKADLYRQAKRDAAAVRMNDFDARQRLDLLAQNDLEGKRESLRAALDKLHAMLRPLDASKDLIEQDFLKSDVEQQEQLAGDQRDRFAQAAAQINSDYWHAAPAPLPVEGAFQRLQAEKAALDSAKQDLLDDYLAAKGDDPNQFLLRDVALDRYLMAQKTFDDELIKTFESKEVANDQSLSWALDAMYDVRGVIDREIDQTRSGRGMAALDALMMLERSRLAAARWNGRPPEELDAIAAALQSLQDTKDRWKAGSTDLVPLYAVTQVAADGQRLWTIDGWLTKDQFDKLVADKSISQHPDGRYYTTAGQLNGAFSDQEGKSKIAPTTSLEVVGGVDALEKARDAARANADAARGEADVVSRMSGYDFALDRRVESGPDAGVGGYSVDRVFGPQGLASMGRVFFFDASNGQMLSPLEALRMPPQGYQMLVYEGDKPLAHDLYPTLGSLKDSPDAKDFYRAELSKLGVDALTARLHAEQATELAQGWVDVKLNGYGFARDQSGSVVQVYSTRDDFQAMQKAFQNAVPDLAKAQQADQQAQAAVKTAQADFEAKQAQDKQASAQFKLVRLAVTNDPALMAQLKRDMPQKPGESEADWDKRLAPILEQRVVRDPRYIAAQEKYQPIAKALTNASDALKKAKADQTNADQAVTDAQTILDHSKTWNLYESDALALSLDAQGELVHVYAQPVYGKAGLDQDVTKGGPVASRIEGPLLAAAVDSQGRVLDHYSSDDALASAARQWTLKSVGVEGDETSGGQGTTIQPTMRISHYEEQVAGQAVPVSLSRRYLAREYDDANSKLWHDKYWGLMPWRWGSLIMEIPKGATTDVAVELLTGRDTRQEHYMGRVYMYKTEGGATERYGFFRQVANVLDVLDLLPDKVDRYLDPSMFPSTVQIDSPIQPGQTQLDKDARAGSQDIHYGAKMAQRVAGYSMEDLTTAKSRTLAHFNGGVETLLVEQLRGRKGPYIESHRSGEEGIDPKTGKPYVDDELTDRSLAADQGSDGSQDILRSATPGNVLVDQVTERLRIDPGAAGYAQEAAALDGYAASVAQRLKQAGPNADQATKDAIDAQAALDAGIKSRDQFDTQTAAVWDAFHALAWRKGAQDALEQELKDLAAKEAQMQKELGFWNGYLSQLTSNTPGPVVPTPSPAPSPNPAPVVNPVTPVAPPTPVTPVSPAQAPDGGFWALAFAAFGLAALASALAAWWRRRRPTSGL